MTAKIYSVFIVGRDSVRRKNNIVNRTIVEAAKYPRVIGTYSNLTLTLFGDGIGALVLMPVIVSDLSQISQFPAQLWLIVLAIGWIPSLLAYSSFSYALKYVKASRGTMLNVLEPVATAVLSAIVIGEAFENLQIIGAVLALAGVLLLFRTGKTFPSDKAAFQHMPTSNVL